MEIGSAPHGTVNHFLRSFGEGKADLFRDIPSVSSAEAVIPTDVIKVGNNFAINGCAVGLTPAVTVKIREMDAKFKNGLNRFSAAIWSFLCNLTSMFDKDIMAHQYKITIDGQDYSGAYSLVNILNGPYFGRKKNPLAGAMPNDGFMDVVLFKSTGILMLLGSLGRYFRGKMPSICTRVQAKKVVIRSDKPMQIQTDSEYLLDTNITFEIVPDAVQVIAVNNLTYQGSQK
jgi:diacylglycerol kinase family enzyme